MMSSDDTERRPLLSTDGHLDSGSDTRYRGDSHHENEQKVDFDDQDTENPKQWPLRWKHTVTLALFFIALILPMASSVFAPAIDQITSDFETSKQAVLAGQTVFICMLGIGPLFLAPMSETFGRRPIFLINLGLFTLVQIPTALASNIHVFVVMRALSGLFGSVGVANGGGTISDLYDTRERSKVLGFYLTGPLLGPTLGPLIGGVIVGRLHWRWIFFTFVILSAILTVICYFILHETRAVTILQQRKKRLEKQNPKMIYTVEGVSEQTVLTRVTGNSTRAVRILCTQPVVMIMSLYQALIFSSMYSLYAEYKTMWSSAPYMFNNTQVGLAYLGPATGFIVTAVFIVKYIDTIYNRLSRKHDDEGQPEFRLPLANLGAVLLPISLFWYGWTIDSQLEWPIPLAATLLFGASQVSIFNTVQTYYIDAYESNAASALAAGAFLRSMIGGVVPLFVGPMFENLGYGWGMSVFGILSLVLMPAPVLFFYLGKGLREKFPFQP